MREIKFRGKRKDNGKWVCGDILKDRNTIYIIPNESSIWVNYLQKEDESYHTQLKVIAYKVDPETIGQFTGLTDKNGKQIYEGDEISFKYQDDLEEEGFGICSGIVTFEKGCFLVKQVGFNYEKAKEQPSSLASWLKDDVCEVIGNIHENPTK